MRYKKLGRTGWDISVVSFGAWAIGGTWGRVDDSESLKALHRAADRGVNFFDTADVYGNGHSERLIGRFKRERREKIYVATKAGRSIAPHAVGNYTRKNLHTFVERSLKNLGTDSIDLLQLHCPPTQVYYMPEIFGILDDLMKEGKISHYGVSVEKVEEALKAIAYANVQSVQIIFNMFRQRPAELFFEQAIKQNVGIIARVPLASGLLTGKLKEDSSFASDDHRNFNRQGTAFDQGETFSGIDYSKGIKAVNELRAFCPKGLSLAQFALRWILMFDAVTCTIPGAKTDVQVDENVLAASGDPLSDNIMENVNRCYKRFIKIDIHHRW